MRVASGHLRRRRGSRAALDPVARVAHLHSRDKVVDRVGVLTKTKSLGDYTISTVTLKEWVLFRHLSPSI